MLLFVFFILCLNIPYGIWNKIDPLVSKMDDLGLNIPYGIWNKNSFNAHLENKLLFEHTLWDLKHIARLFLRVDVWVWTYPMGFETIISKIYKFGLIVWTYPMGFETRRG